jgi:hypothetical protein
MRPPDALARLQQLLAQAEIPFESDPQGLHGHGEDLLLHESGSSDGTAYSVDVCRQFSFEDETGDYAGMNALGLTIVCERAPEGRIPRAQRWGYAGTRREDSDEKHPELRNWAGWVDSWKRAAERSTSVKVLDEIAPVAWHAHQSDI